MSEQQWTVTTERIDGEVMVVVDTSSVGPQGVQVELVGAAGGDPAGHQPQPEQPYGPGALCEECGHFACRHNPEGCQFPRPADDPCRCSGMLWHGVRWPRPWLAAPAGLREAL
jgi:hypothetical protein